MEINKQSQSAGDNAQQFQAATIIVQNGITEERVREVCLEMSKKAMAECTVEAEDIAVERIQEFGDVLIPRIEKCESGFEIFSDPAFQVLLKKAQLTAACTERKDDYELLSELLVHRAENKANIKKKASISKAVEIVDQIDDDSLLALTVFLAVEQFMPTSGNISEGLGVLSELYSSFDLDNLPNDNLWLDNLAILGAINEGYFVMPCEYYNFLSENLSGYVCAGIKKDSNQYADAVSLLSQSGISESVLIENELLDGYVRLKITDQYVGLEGVSQLRAVYPLCLEIQGKSFESEGAGITVTMQEFQEMENDPMAVFNSFCKDVMNDEPSEHIIALFKNSMESEV